MMRGAGLSSRKSEFILNVSLCVCVFRWFFFWLFRVPENFCFGIWIRYKSCDRDACRCGTVVCDSILRESTVLEDWKVELIVHTEGFSFFFFSRNRLNDFMKMYYSIFSLITLFLFTFP